MGKAKDKVALKLPKAEDVGAAKPVVAKIARAKARLATAQERVAAGGATTKSDPRIRAAKKRVKRAQRKLRETLKYAVSRAKPVAPVAAEAPPAS